MAKIPLMAEQMVRGIIDNPCQLQINSYPDNKVEVIFRSDYGTIRFKNKKSFLIALQELAQIFEATEADIETYLASDGCPTCGYGTEYNFTLVFWGDK